ncbi:hypothetical protein CISIN_1g034193mg [Citrus sinensis]|uniref:Uncharacterized protein n=1 Tax=Citrus sinensis TaxID=2711 RepID=A0A067DSU1_CITSI|nr:hypothetical protein CISIN_1g034193mg [Citrus sinensis]
MADLPGYMRACLHTGKLAFLAILVSGGIVLQILACALYNNWWPMLTGKPHELFVFGVNGVLFLESILHFVANFKYIVCPAIGQLSFMHAKIISDLPSMPRP